MRRCPRGPPLPGGGLHFDESVHVKMLLMGVVEDGQFLVGEVLRCGRNAQVSHGFHVIVHEKELAGLFFFVGWNNLLD